ncbi:MAG: response regulator transcription factor [Clostridiales bacterium]|nr:response regulator transcription factor [Clostridiales bacterium]
MVNDKKPNILIVEDDSSINNLIYDALKKHGCDCVQAYSGTEGILNFKNAEFDLVILDLMMPGMTGEELTRQIREINKTPIIVVSAKCSTESRIDLLAMGADDFLSKPFDVKELLARVDVQLRHLSYSGKEEEEQTDEMKYKDLVLNRSTYEAVLCGKDLQLTRQEYKILELFMLYPSKVFSKQEIYEYAWNDYYMGEDKTINVHISNIRSKMKKITQDEYIDTVWGIGFRLSKPK